MIKSPSPLNAARMIKAVVKAFKGRAPAWIKMLEVAAGDMLDSTDATRLLNLELCKVGQEKGASMLTDPKITCCQCSDFLSLQCFLRSLKDLEYEVKILW